MRLIRCEIENFGKLQHCRLELQDGLNMLSEENGFGKTTLCAFLKAMLYGMPSRGKDSDREQYRPWQGGIYGGNLTFETGERVYCVTRRFAQRASGDFFELRDSHTGLVSGDFTDRLGEELLGIDRESFQRTVFMSGGEWESGGTDSIQARISATIQRAEGMEDFEKARAALEEAGKCLRTQRGTGRMDKLEKHLEELELQELEEGNLQRRTEKLRQELENGVRRKEELSRKLQLCREEEEKRRERRELGEIAGEWENLCREEESEERHEKEAALSDTDTARFEELDALFDEAVGDPDEARLKWNQCRQDRRRAEKIREAVALRRKEEEDACRAEKRNRRRLYGAGFLFLLSGFLIFFWQEMIALLIILLGCVLLLGAFFHGRKHTVAEDPGAMEAKMRDELAELEKSIRVREEEIAGILGSFGYEFSQEFAGEDLESLSAMKRERNWLLHARRSQEACRERMDGIRERKREYFRRYQKQLQKWEQLKEETCREQGAESGREQHTESESGREQGTDWEALRQELQDCEREVRYLESALGHNLDACREKERRQERITRMREELQRMQGMYEDLELAGEFLTEARNRITADLQEPVREAFSYYYGQHCAQEKMNWHLDANSRLTMEVDGVRREAEAFSKGSRELYGFLLRISLVRAMYDRERPFLLLDDPFADLDDERLQDCLALLDELALEYQIVYFTCSSVRMPRKACGIRMTDK